MLELKNITKNYLSGDNEVKALKGISIEFRESEFVSILGQSGCGKTTLLNIIGGLDRYTSGDLIINGKSTKDFNDRDWDTYRNHSVGFVFQNYNLITHQNVLSNVELALTLNGIKKSERRKRAIKALEDVGLKDQIYKKPNQLSGGQMQRVAIARALVNDPDIILADEPTGALDTETSKQVMEVLKKISEDKLIIMVTHNKELAEEYSSRIVRILDGNIINDSNPYTENDKKEEKKKEEKAGKTSMSFFTAFALSLNNLMTKKGRTFLTAFAGSIGIIGIALILSLSSGVQNYISRVEEDTLSSYPITIEEESVDMSVMLETLMGEMGSTDNENDEDKIYSVNIMTDIISSISQEVQTNNLTAFKEYLENEDTVINENSTAIQYSYDLDLNLYKSDTTDGVYQVNPSQVLETIGLGEMFESSSDVMSLFSGSSSVSATDIWSELLDNQELLEVQYDVLAGRFPESYNEVVLIVDENNQVSDYTLYALGIKDSSEIDDMFSNLQAGTEYEKNDIDEYSYDDFVGLTYKVLLNTDYYEKENGIWVDKSDDTEYMTEKVNEAEEITIVGIIKPNEESNVGSTTYGEIGYLKDLKEYVIEKINESEIAQEQLENPTINVFTGTEFDSSETFSIENLTDEQKLQLSQMTEEEQLSFITAYAENSDATYESNLELLGIIDLDSPSAINIYPKSFEAKDLIKEAIDDYNDGQEEEDVIEYSDLVGTLMSSVTNIINIISYVLIAFVAISLVVSSIMIGIITYISVLERTKEIGILRAIGASKKDISRVFNAETFIIGLTAGILGIVITIILNIPINIVIKYITGVSGISSLPVYGAVILIIISMILTVISGLIPAKMAAKKDPVEALRTE